MAITREARDRALRNYKISFGIAAAAASFLLEPKLSPLIARGDVSHFFSYLTAICLALLLLAFLYEVWGVLRESATIPVRLGATVLVLLGFLFVNIRDVQKDRQQARFENYNTAEGLTILYRSRDPYIRAMAFELARHRGYHADQLHEIIQHAMKDDAAIVQQQLQIFLNYSTRISPSTQYAK